MEHCHFVTDCMSGSCPPMAFMPMIIVPLLIIAMHVMAIRYVALWFVFKKAGEQGWASIIPVYNILIVIRIAGKPWWYILLLLIPIVNIIIGIMILHGLSKSFGKSGWFTVGLIFLRVIFLAILGFGDAQYSGDKTRYNS
ncbi:MAG: DUF5684 domain-containing protein [Bacteroidetes bacterium]|nr:DUF5684 domain-containing protein [Bacteroidota bacterium]